MLFGLNRFPLPPIRSIRIRLTGLFLLIFGITLIVFSSLLYEAFSRNSQEEFDAALYNHAVDVANAIEVDFFGDLSLRSNLFSESAKIFPFALGKALVQIRAPSGTVVASSRSADRAKLPFNNGTIVDMRTRKTRFESFSFDSTHFRMVSYLINKPIGKDTILQIAVPTTFLEREQKGVLTFFLFAVPLVLLIATLGGWFLSYRALRPIRAIIKSAHQISANSLFERVPVPQVQDEIQQLSLTINGLLERLQKSFQSQERFIADASHELKTPLAILRGELDLMQSRPRSEKEVSDFMASASQEINYLSRIVGDLLILARVDAGMGSLTIEPVRVDEVAMDVVARMEKLAQSKKLKIRLNLHSSSSTSPFEIQGDSDLVHCMLDNFIENAIKFSPPESPIELDITDAESAVRIKIKDKGPGISAEMQAKIFERFFRIQRDKANTKGVGLGLPISKRIIEAHKGSLGLDSSPTDGTTFAISLPKVI